MTYELWNMRTGNAIAEFGTETEALAAVREVIARHGRAYVDALLLGSTSSGRSRPVAQGQVLAERALAAQSLTGAAHPNHETGTANSAVTTRPSESVARTGHSA